MKKTRVPKFAVLLFAAFVLSFLLVQTLLDAGLLFGFAAPAIGLNGIDAKTGAIQSVVAGSPAALSRVRAGDQLDISRDDWAKRLWLRYGRLRAGDAVPLPVIRNGTPVVLTLSVQHAVAAPINNIVADVLTMMLAIVFMVIGCALYFASGSSLSFALMVFCVTYMASAANVAWMRVVPPWAQPLAGIVATIPVVLLWGYLRFCLRFPSGEAIGRWRIVDRFVTPWTLFICLVYYAHFYTATLVWSLSGKADPLYYVFTAGVWGAVVLGAIAFLARYREARGADTIRMRWVGLALAIYLLSNAAFFLDQIVNTNLAWVAYLPFFNPAPFAFAYAMLRGRIVDLRIVGGRAVVYATLTAIPVALLAVVDWFFARRLQDARLATFLEVAVAVAFSFWLRSLHRRIERFVERVFFASRHRALERVRHITRALPFSERIETIESLLCDEIAAALQLASAALFRADRSAFVLTSSRDWEGGAQRLDPDDPLILFARSSHSGIHFDDVPRTRVPVPSGDAKPAFGLPVTVGRRVIAVVLYGNHLNGEPIDGEEEELLNAAAHASATAYEHLHALEREREITKLRAQLQLEAPA